MATVLSLTTTLLGETPAWVAALVLGALAVAGLWRLRPAVAGTTLVAPWRWSLAAIVASVTAAACAVPANTPLHYLAGTLLLAPPMSTFGAKRPQHSPWQWVVLAFLVLLALPAINQWLYRPGAPLQPDPAWQWLLTIALMMGTINFLPTSRAGSATAYVLGAGCWLAVYLPSWLQFAIPHRELLGLLLLVLAIASALRVPRRKAGPPLERLWLDFRDHFGVVWAVRVAEQFNATAGRAGWPLRLNWQDVEYADKSNPTAPLPTECRQALENLLRRFVSREWIDRRLQRDVAR